jgi:Co/Zn/Cd efflux system component
VEAQTAPDPLLAEIAHELEHHFAISHSTIQLEHGDPAHPCPMEH